MHIVKHKYWHAYDENGNIVLPKDAVRGKKYRCPYCSTGWVSVVIVQGRDPYYRGISGSHSGDKCTRLSDGANYKLIDIEAILRKGSDKGGFPGPGGKRPGKPRTGPKTVVGYGTLQNLIDAGWADIDNCQIGSGKTLVDLYISTRNAYLSLHDNDSLGIRAMELQLDIVLPLENKIRCHQQARRGQNGMKTAARRVVDLVFADNSTYREVRDMLFVMGRDKKGDLHYFPRFETVHILGIFIAQYCSQKHPCAKSPFCGGKYIHCVGIQTVKIEDTASQIVCQNEIDYSWINGWYLISE